MTDMKDGSGWILGKKDRRIQVGRFAGGGESGAYVENASLEVYTPAPTPAFPAVLAASPFSSESPKNAGSVGKAGMSLTELDRVSPRVRRRLTRCLWCQHRDALRTAKMQKDIPAKTDRSGVSAGTTVEQSPGAAHQTG